VLGVHLGALDGVHDHGRCVGRAMQPLGGGDQPIILLGRHQDELAPSVPSDLDGLTLSLMLEFAEFALEFESGPWRIPLKRAYTPVRVCNDLPVGSCSANKNLLDGQAIERSQSVTAAVVVKRIKASGEAAFYPKRPCDPGYQSRSAMPPGALPDAGSSTRRAVARPSGRTASRCRRSPRW